MISIKNSSELEVMDRCNRIVLTILGELGALVVPGADVEDLDQYAETRTREEGARPAFKGYHDFPSTLCVSVNEQVVHGIPRPRRLCSGDIVSLDFGVVLDGYFGDGAHTFAVGEIDSGRHGLLRATLECLRLGIEEMRAGSCIGNIGHAIQGHGEATGHGVVREFVGHGIGQQLHEPPEVPNHGDPGRGVSLRQGMVLAVEPMLNMGTSRVRTAPDRWTVTTADGLPSAHFERSVAVTEAGPWVLGSGRQPGTIDLDLPVPAAAAVAAGKVTQ